MYSWRARPCAVIPALAASDHFVLLHYQQPTSHSQTRPIIVVVLVVCVPVFFCLWICRCRSASHNPRRQPPKVSKPQHNGNAREKHNQKAKGETVSKPQHNGNAREKHNQKVKGETGGGASSTPRVHAPKKFKYEELYKATKGFSKSKKLGQGGFGTVYKGVLPADANNKNKIVAIKKLNSRATQGKKEFLTEVEVIILARHRHIVSLVGFFIGQVKAHPETRMMLVYKFITNKSLDFHLYGQDTQTLDWEKRMKIAIGSAKGLAYLHEDCDPKIIHRDIKSSNILLDDDFQPKIADFGLAKLLPDHATHVFTLHPGAGTFGYLAPECLASGEISEKSDVFAFGVVLLEMITGQTPLGVKDGLVKWARPKLSAAFKSKERKFKDLADPRLRNNYDSERMFRMVSCAANCVNRSAERRPTMRKVVDALEGKTFLDNRDEVSTQVNNEDINKFWKSTLSGVDVTEHSEPSSSSHQNT